MKAGEIYERDGLIYMIVADYGKFRPLVIDGTNGLGSPSNYFMNMSYDVSPKNLHQDVCHMCKKPSEPMKIYKDEIKIADSIEEYLKSKGSL